jgi:hypothetical protein
MLTVRIIAVLFILLGIAGLNIGHVTFAQELEQDSLGPVVLVEKTIVIPHWLSIGVIVMGGIILVGSTKKEPK